MEIGDKVKCILGCRAHFIRNEIYTVTIIMSDRYGIDGYGFNIKREKEHYNFDDHFVLCLKELRRYKLKKLEWLK